MFMFGGLSISVLVALNVLYAAVILAIGFALGAWFFSTVHSTAVASPRPLHEAGELQFAADRLTMASMRVADAASNMICDVDAHAAKVGEFDSDLRAVFSEGSSEESQAIFSTIGRMRVANSDL